MRQAEAGNSPSQKSLTSPSLRCGHQWSELPCFRLQVKLGYKDVALLDNWVWGLSLIALTQASPIAARASSLSLK